MQVVITLRGDVVPQLLGEEPAGPDAGVVADAIAERGVEMSPMHPQEPDLTLRRYFVVNVDGYNRAEEVINRLMACPAVEGAYPKPVDEPA